MCIRDRLLTPKLVLVPLLVPLLVLPLLSLLPSPAPSHPHPPRHSPAPRRSLQPHPYPPARAACPDARARCWLPVRPSRASRGPTSLVLLMFVFVSLLKMVVGILLPQRRLPAQVRYSPLTRRIHSTPLPLRDPAPPEQSASIPTPHLVCPNHVPSPNQQSRRNESQTYTNNEPLLDQTRQLPLRRPSTP